MKKKTGNPSGKSFEEFDREFGPIKFDPATFYGENPLTQQRQSNRGYSKNEVRRRQNKKRKIKNKFRNVIITLIAIVAFSALGIALSLTVFFNITDINITGSSIYTKEELKSICTIEPGKNLFLIDTQECIDKFCEALPYVYDVKITRKLPTTLNIEITDAVPAFTIEKEDKTYILLDDRLKVLEASAAERGAEAILITDTAVTAANPGYLIGFENEDVSDCIFQLAQAVISTKMSEATSISSIDKNNNYIVYDNRITFKLGNCNNLESKINKGLAVCEDLNEHNSMIRGTVNLSVDKQSYFTEE